MPDSKYELQSWIDPRIELRPSPIGGKGMFAREPIREGEIVVVWGGIVLTEEEVSAGRYRVGSLSAIGENQWLGSPEGDEDSAADYTNHSCDPNLWMKDEATLMTRRDIEAGEELTADYIVWEGDEDFIAQWECMCGSPLCRKSIMGSDWRLPDLQKRYENYFSPFLNKRIEKEQSLS